jgi:hypothetical protein
MSNIKVLPLSVLTQNTLTLNVNEDIKSVHLNDTLLCNYTEEVYTDSVCHKELQKFFTAIKYSGENLLFFVTQVYNTILKKLKYFPSQ